MNGHLVSIVSQQIRLHCSATFPRVVVHLADYILRGFQLRPLSRHSICIRVRVLPAVYGQAVSAGHGHNTLHKVCLEILGGGQLCMLLQEAPARW